MASTVFSVAKVCESRSSTSSCSRATASPQRIVALVLSAAVACSDDAAKNQEPQPDSPLTTIASTSGTQSPPVVATALVSGVGPGISVADAIDSTLDGPLLVNGFVLAKGGDVRLCDGLLESFPAQCGRPSIVVDGLDLSGLDLTEAQPGDRPRLGRAFFRESDEQRLGLPDSPQ